MPIGITVRVLEGKRTRLYLHVGDAEHEMRQVLEWMANNEDRDAATANDGAIFARAVLDRHPDPADDLPPRP